MDQPSIHTTDQPGSRPATDQEIAQILGDMTALDGTNYFDIYNATRDDD